LRCSPPAVLSAQPSCLRRAAVPCLTGWGWGWGWWWLLTCLLFFLGCFPCLLLPRSTTFSQTQTTDVRDGDQDKTHCRARLPCSRYVFVFFCTATIERAFGCLVLTSSLCCRQVVTDNPVRREPLCRLVLPHDREHVQQGDQVSRARVPGRDHRHCWAGNDNNTFAVPDMAV